MIIHEADGIKVGDKVSVLVTESDEYDLFAVPSAVAAKDDSKPAAVAG